MRMSRKRRKARERRQKVNSIFKGIGTSGAGFTLASLLLLNPFAAPVAQALPTGGEIAAGQAAIAQAGTAMTIQQQTAQAIINWQSFNIAANESVHFQQPGADAVALNRVLGNDPSAIFGSLTANGHVFLVNPNGVFFAPGAQVDVGGLTASTLNITDADFLARNYRFTNDGAAGSVINQGELTAKEGGLIMLLGPEAVNEGVIVAKKGTAALAAGDAVTFDYYGDGKISLTVDEGAARAVAENKGLIEADGGMVVMTARANQELTSSVINQSGIIRASSLDGQGGEVRLDAGQGSVNIDGQIAADGLAGGLVTVSGKAITLDEGAAIDVSGVNGGGTAYIGGQWQGSGDMAHADSVTIKDGASINADATEQGDGGTVVVWSDGTTNFAGGTISAKGGALSGNGGKVETSGHTLNVQGNVNASAANGQGGEWLLDPENITITADGTGNESDTSYASAATISNSLNNGTSVTVKTDTQNDSQIGYINVNSDITGGKDATLTLEAYATVDINANITATEGKLNLVVNSGESTSAGGAVTLASGKTISTGGGNVTISKKDGGYVTGAGTSNGITIAGTIDAGAGAVNMQGAGSSGDGIAISDTGTVAGGDVTLNGKSNSGSGINISGTLTADNATLTADKIALTGTVRGKDENSTATIKTLTDTAAMTLGSGGINTVSLQNFKTATFEGSSLTVNGAGFASTIDEIVLKSNGAINLEGALTASSSKVNLQAVGNAAGAGVITANVLDLGGGSYNLTGTQQVGTLVGSASALTFTNGQELTVGNADKGLTINGDGKITTTDGDLNIGGALTATGKAELTSIAGDLNINAAVNAASADLTAQNIKLGETAKGSLTTTGDIALTTTATAGKLSLANASAIDSGAGNIAVLTAGIDMASAEDGTIKGTGTLSVDSTNHKISLGNNAVDTLNLTSAMLQDGFSEIIIGSDTTTSVDAGGNFTVNDALTIKGNTIDVSGEVKTNDNDLTLAAGAIAFHSGNLSSGSGDMTLNTDSITWGGSFDGSGNLYITPKTNGTALFVGNATGSGLTINQGALTEMNGFSAVQLGSSQSGAATLGSFDFDTNLSINSGGAMTLTDGAVINGAGQTLLLNAASLSQGTTGSITVDTLGLKGDGAFNLLSASNAAANVAADVGSLTLLNQATNIGTAAGLIDGAAANLSGITADGAITIRTDALTGTKNVTTSGELTLLPLTASNINIGTTTADGALNIASSYFAPGSILGGSYSGIVLGGTNDGYTFNGNIDVNNTTFSSLVKLLTDKTSVGGTVTFNGTVKVGNADPYKDMYITAWSFAMPTGSSLNVHDLTLDIGSGLTSGLAGTVNGTGAMTVEEPADSDIYISNGTHAGAWTVSYNVLNNVMQGFKGYTFNGHRNIILETGTLNKSLILETDGAIGGVQNDGKIILDGMIEIAGTDTNVELTGKKLETTEDTLLKMTGTNGTVTLTAGETTLNNNTNIDVGNGSFTLVTDKLNDNTGSGKITGTGNLTIKQQSNTALDINTTGTGTGLVLTNTQLNGGLFDSDFASLTLGNDEVGAAVTVDGVSIANDVTIQTGANGTLSVGSGGLTVADNHAVTLRGGTISNDGNTINAGNGTINFYTNNLGGLSGINKVIGSGTLGISSYDGSTAISLGDNSHGGLYLSNDMFTGGVFSNSFTDYSIGSAAQDTIYVDDVSLTKNLTLTAGKIDFKGDLALTDNTNNKLTLNAKTGAYQTTKDANENNDAPKEVDSKITVGDLKLTGTGEYYLNSDSNVISGTLSADKATRVEVASDKLNIGKINANGGAIILSADEMSFTDDASLESKGGLLTLQQLTNGTTMQLGGTKAEGFSGLYLKENLFGADGIVKKGFDKNIYLGLYKGTGDVNIGGTLDFQDTAYIRATGGTGSVNMWENSAILAGGDGVTIQSGNFTTANNATIDATRGGDSHKQNITISTNDMTLADSTIIKGNGELTLETWSWDEWIWLGGEGPGPGPESGLWIKKTYFGSNGVFKDGFDTIILGNANATGTLKQTDSIDFQDNVQIIQGKDTTNGGGYIVDTTDPNGITINTNGQDYSIESSKTVLNNVHVNAGDGDVSIKSDYLELKGSNFTGHNLLIDTYSPETQISLGGSSGLVIVSGWFAEGGAFAGMNGNITLGSEANTGGIHISDNFDANKNLSLVTGGAITSENDVTLDLKAHDLNMQGASINVSAGLANVGTLKAEAAGDIKLSNTGNTIANLGNISGANVSITDSNGLNVVGTVTGTGDVNVTTTNGNVTIGTAGQLAGENVYVDAAKGHFTNASGTDGVTVTADGGHWVIHTYDSIDDDYGGLTGDFREYGQATIDKTTTGSGSQHVYQPTATIHAEKTYGQTNESFFGEDFSITINDTDKGAARVEADRKFLGGGDSFSILDDQKNADSYTFGSAIQDIASGNYGNSLQVNKNINGINNNNTTAYGTAYGNSGNSDYNITYLQDNNTLNYKIETKFWVKPKEVTVTAASHTIDYSTLNGGSYQGNEIINGTFGHGISYDGFVNGETIDTASGKTGSVQYTGSSQTAAAPGEFVIGLNGNLQANNYIFTYQNGTLTITDTNGAYVPPVTPEPSLPNGSDAALSTSGDASQVTQQNVNTVLQPPTDSINTIPTNGYEGSMGSDMPTNLNDNLAKLPVNTDNVYGALDSAAAETMPQGDVTVQFDGADREYSFTADRNGFGFELVGQSPLGGYQTSKTDGAVPVVFTDYDSNGQTVTQALDGFYDISYNAERLNIKPQAQGSAIPELSEISPELKQSFKVDYNGNEGEFTVSYGNGIITVEPINDAAAEMVGDGDNKKCQAIVATSILRSVQDLAVMPDQVRAVYVYKSKRPLRTYAVRMG